MAHDVFISYCSEDKPTADAICATLEAKGVRCWIAPRDILPGLDWSAAIVDAIGQARVMVLVYSASANESPQIKREVERAVSKGLAILPFRIQDVPLSKSLEYFISSPHWLDALTPPLERHAEYLATTVVALLAVERGEPRPRTPPPLPGPARRRGLAGAAVGVLALLVVLGGGFFALKGGRGAPGEPDFVGHWQATVPKDGIAWTWNSDIRPTGEYHVTLSMQDRGRLEARQGHYRSVSVTQAVADGMYHFLGPDSFTMNGPLGTATWTRKAGTAGGSEGSPLTGVWQSTTVRDGVTWKSEFAILDADYRFTSVSEDGGVFQAAGGRWKTMSNTHQVAEGTYAFLGHDAVSMTGPLGSAVWHRR